MSRKQFTHVSQAVQFVLLIMIKYSRAQPEKPTGLGPINMKIFLLAF